MSHSLQVTAHDSWNQLRRHTAARIGLGRAGAGLPTAETLRFKLAHAQARDAVHEGLDDRGLLQELMEFSLGVHCVQSLARDRQEYLHRPDYGRGLNQNSRKLLGEQANADFDLAIVIADGLSARAIGNHAVRFLRVLLPMLPDWRLAPLVVAHQGRVAIGDEIGFLLRAQSVVVMIGERPGLSSPDSLGIYMTYAPSPGMTDERRNCISNIRDEGLSHQAGATKLAWLLQQSFSRKLSGVRLKEETKEPPPGLCFS